MIIACYIAAVAADILSTRYALGRGGVEANPLLRLAGRFWLPVRLVMAALIAIVAIQTGVEWTLWVAAAVYAGVAVSNLLMLRSA